MGDQSASIAGEWKTVKVSRTSKKITNPIRDIVDRLVPPKEHRNSFLSLSIGDPTVFGNLLPPREMTEALVEKVRSHKFDGYGHAAGFASVREAVARNCGVSGLTSNDVIMASGGSGALEMIINVLAEENSNMLLPSPGFSLYQTLLRHRQAEPRYYKLLPERGWECDLEHMESLIDDNTVGILVNNPSNPCGSVYSRDHLLKIIEIAERHHLPIIADEIYAKLVWGDEEEFFPLGALSRNVPILSVSGLAKMYVVPGWRIGWIVIHDRHGVLSEVRTALNKQTQLILGPSTLIQSVVETALESTPPSYHEQLTNTLHEHATLLCDRLEKVPGLTVVRPHGAMYMMLGFQKDAFNFADDVEFARLLLTEENLSILPGTIFTCPFFLRIVICAPNLILEDACNRIEAFCTRHYKGPVSTASSSSPPTTRITSS